MTSSAGPVSPSEGLRALLRLRRALVRHMPERREELSPTANEVALTFLEEVEAASAVTLPDDVVILATLRIPAVVRAVGLRVEHLGAPIRDCAGDFGPPRGWLAVASFGREAMRQESELALLGRDTLLAISTKCARDGDPKVRTVDESGASPAEPLSTVIRERWKTRYARSERWTAALDDARSDTTDDEECVVRIVDDRPKPKAAVRVIHAKFGEGTVVRELEDGKLVIAFDGGDTKTLQRSFVREL